jgi:hypothetical protein
VNRKSYRTGLVLLFGLLATVTFTLFLVSGLEEPGLLSSSLVSLNAAVAHWTDRFTPPGFVDTRGLVVAIPVFVLSGALYFAAVALLDLSREVAIYILVAVLCGMLAAQLMLYVRRQMHHVGGNMTSGSKS